MFINLGEAPMVKIKDFTLVSKNLGHVSFKFLQTSRPLWRLKHGTAHDDADEGFEGIWANSNRGTSSSLWKTIS